MDFAAAQLAKYGWNSGQGLGKSKGKLQPLLTLILTDGITKAVRLGWKNDKKGLAGSGENEVYASWRINTIVIRSLNGGTVSTTSFQAKSW